MTHRDPEAVVRKARTDVVVRTGYRLIEVLSPVVPYQ